jgi:hypothetical protein
MTQVHATIAHHSFDLRSADVERALQGVLPEPLDDHYVVIDGRRFPPKQVVSLLTGLDRADFNTHQARQVLRRLGFTVSRRSELSSRAMPTRPAPDGRSTQADLLRPHRGQWVAQRGEEILVAADEPAAVLEWLERHDQRADAMFRVPRDEHEAAGLAPR